MRFNFISLILAMVCVVITTLYFDASQIEALLVGVSYGIVSQI